MLPQIYRLTKNKNFEWITKKGQSIYCRELGLKWIKNDLAFSRFGIVISLKVSKKATVRNKIKRRIRAIIYQSLKTIKPRYDIIISTKPEIRELDYWQIKEKLEKLFDRAGLMV